MPKDNRYKINIIRIGIILKSTLLMDKLYYISIQLLVIYMPYPFRFL